MLRWMMAILATASVLSGCGQKGPLYLPPAPTLATPAAPDAGAVSDAPADRPAEKK